MYSCIRLLIEIYILYSVNIIKSNLLTVNRVVVTCYYSTLTNRFLLLLVLD